ncbi:hypothetical protein N7468_000861 [Penicillium chermesinum]|uniref:Uncharacterized protein n=1 Tax=Penicillium chermesinum TaxID=63820 RepID=A0A9W9PHR0_9EURO|nr:uncharacterized protein N7468_000861 [Penicillium chermesinum]KAJ5245878.1 hypothetical protein N7468_000861 [Penicillium chermesinum]
MVPDILNPESTGQSEAQVGPLSCSRSFHMLFFVLCFSLLFSSSLGIWDGYTVQGKEQRMREPWNDHYHEPWEDFNTDHVMMLGPRHAGPDSQEAVAGCETVRSTWALGSLGLSRTYQTTMLSCFLNVLDQ